MYTTKNILGIAHPKHYILLLVSRILEGNLGYFALVVASNQIYTKSLVNTNSFYTNFTNTHFQKVPIPHLTRTMKQKFFH